MNTKRTLIYLKDGRAWVAELQNGRARVSSLVAWLSAHPGRSALSALVAEPPPRPAPSGGAPRAGPALGGLVSPLESPLNTRTS